MSRFDRYMLSQLMAVFGFFSLILVAVYWVNRAVVLFDQIIGSGQSARVFLELSALTLPNVIRIVLPIAAFAAALYATNRLSAESELVVMQATGFSPFRLARPVLIFGLIVAGILSLLVHWLVPGSRAEYGRRTAEIAQGAGARLLAEGRFLHPSRGITFYIRDITPEGELRDVFLSDSRDAAQRRIYTAKRALLVQSDTGPKLIMLDGMAQALDPAGNRLAVTGFGDFTYDVGALIETRERVDRDLRSLASWRLAAPDPALIAAMGQTTAAPFRQELIGRVAATLLAPAAAMIGFAALLLGAYSRFGLWRQVLAAVLVIIAIQFLDNAAGGMARGRPGGWPLLFAAPLAGAAAAAGMLAAAGRERRPRQAARTAARARA